MISSKRRSTRRKEPLLERLVDLYLSKDDVIAELRVTLYIKKRSTKRSRRIAYVTKEGNMRIFTAESVDLSHLNPGQYSYEPKNIHIQAVQVTPENIGKLSLEFEEELYYDAQGRPYFVFTAERVQVEGGELANQVLYARVTDWIVPLRGELHIYRDLTFQNTFTEKFEKGSHRAAATLARPYVEYEQDGVLMKAPIVKPKWDIDGAYNETLPREYRFGPDDRVHVVKTGDRGIVTVLNVEHEGQMKIEVKLDNGDYRYFDENELDYVPKV